MAIKEMTCGTQSVLSSEGTVIPTAGTPDLANNRKAKTPNRVVNFGSDQRLNILNSGENKKWTKMHAPPKFHELYVACAAYVARALKFVATVK